MGGVISHNRLPLGWDGACRDGLGQAQFADPSVPTFIFFIDYFYYYFFSICNEGIV